MSDLKQMIKNEFDKDRGLSKKIAKIAGYKNPTPLYKFLNEPDRELDNFYSLLKIVRELFPEREYELMDKYLRTVDPKKKTARVGLEYASVYRLSDLQNHLIEKMINCSNLESKEWATVYKIGNEEFEGKIPYMEVIEKTTTINYKTIEAKLFSKFIQIYSCYELKFISTLIELATMLEPEIELIKDEFMKRSFKARIGLVMTTVSLHSNNLEEIREYGNMVLEHSTKLSILSVVHLQMGNSYIYTDFDKAHDHFNKGIEMCNLTKNENTMTELKRSMNFLMNYWGKEPLYLNRESKHSSDIHEVAFYYIQQGNKEKGIELLESVDFESMNNLSRAFNIFYKGLATDNKNFYYESIRYFNLAGEKFYKNLPLIELKKLGENEVLLSALSS